MKKEKTTYEVTVLVTFTVPAESIGDAELVALDLFDRLQDEARREEGVDLNWERTTDIREVD